MGNLTIILLIIAIIFILIMLAKIMKLSNQKDDEDLQEEKEVDKENGEAEVSEEYPYIKTYLLTKKEWSFYKNLKPITDKYNLHILSKVRLADLIEVKKGLNKSQYFKAFAKIKSKHVDFVLANPTNLAIKCIIEVDDKSHDIIDRQQRDYFLDKVCETVKLPIIHCTNIEGVEDKICDSLKIHKK